ncbi:beta-lactoglobulin-1-like [Dugong dugon]
MAASNLPLLETEDAPLRVYIKEIRPTPDDNLEVVLLKTWVCPLGCSQAARERQPVPAALGVRAGLRRFLVPSAQPKGFQLNRLTAQTHPGQYLDENKVFMLDTDYKNYLFTCMESTIAPEQDLVCQYLARTLKVDTNVMEKFKVVLKT